MNPISLRLVHPAAWGGLLLHCVFVVLMYMLKDIPRADLSAEETAMLDLFAAAIPFLQGIIAVQCVALWLIISGSRLGVIAAVVSGCLTIPAGFIYIVGCLFTYHAVRFAPFERALRLAPGRAFPSAFVAPLFAAAVGCLFGAVLCFFLSQPASFVALFLSAGFLALYLSRRVSANPPLALGRDGLTLTPAIFSERLRLPYASISKATLLDNQSILFTVRTPYGQKELVWPLASVRADSRREAFDALGEALEAAAVPMD